MLFPNSPLVYTILAVDPGSKFTGVSRFDIDIRHKKILSIKTDTIRIERLKNDTGLVEEFIEPKFLRYYKLREEFIRRLHKENPHYIAYEAPFMNAKQPTAYGPLVSVMTLVHDSLRSYNQGCPFFTMSPQQVKKAVGVAGKKGKDVMKAAIEKIPEVMEALDVGGTDINTLDDNAIDSIAVGYCAIKLDIFIGVP